MVPPVGEGNLDVGEGNLRWKAGRTKIGDRDISYSVRNLVSFHILVRLITKVMNLLVLEKEYLPNTITFENDESTFRF